MKAWLPPLHNTIKNNPVSLNKLIANNMMTLSLKSKFLLLCLLLSCSTGTSLEANSIKKVEGMFVFGSSLVDNGNNNFLQGSPNSNFLPYGIDFPLGPSGRFTNGKNVIDLLGEQLKLPGFIPPFADPSTKGKNILHGVNYASGGAGILDNTGPPMGNVTNVNQQIRNFETITLPELKSQLRNDEDKNSLSDYVFLFGVGANDYTINYFRPPGLNNSILEAFTANLTTMLSSQLKKLYSLGARKFILMALYPIGCSPGIRSLQQTEGCIDLLNMAAQIFNTHLKTMVDVLKIQTPGSTFVIVDQYNIIMDITNDPVSKGFKDVNNPCCETVLVVSGRRGVACRPGGKVCSHRSTYLYFDGLHPTEAVNIQIASKAFASDNKTEVYPINVKQLANR